MDQKIPVSSDVGYTHLRKLFGMVQQYDCFDINVSHILCPFSPQTVIVLFCYNISFEQSKPSAYPVGFVLNSDVYR